MLTIAYLAKLEMEQLLNDLHLNHVAGTVAADRDTTQTTQYLLNLCFSDALQVHSSTKFPGTQVVALERKDLSLLHGCRPVHQLYKAPEIFSWLSPQVLTIPRLNFASRWFFVASETKTCDVMVLDFAFDTTEDIPLVSQLDFCL